MNRRAILAPIIALMFCIATSVGVSSCALTQDRPETVRLIVQAATLKVIDGDPAKAERIVDIATKVRSIASAESGSTVAALIELIRSEIDWASVEPEESLLYQALLLELRFRLEDHLGPDPLPADLQFTVNTITTWVIETASLAVPPT